jgi:lipopolysaccharide transport system ATP-binding protein
VSLPSIEVHALGKRYRLGGRQEPYKLLTESLASWLRHPLSRWRAPTGSTFWALAEVSFQISPGEVVGVIGANGAGKSTLLKILSRITAPTVGHAVLRGRVGSLLEVGTGFHPELTGRENVYLNGAIMGMKKAEVARKFDAIVDFAGIETFLDTPVKRYSSGMYVRLAFAVAAHLEPETLLVDEVLAVGDAAFQKKCLGKMGEVARQGRTVLLVSHNMGSIRQLCARSLWIDQGRLRADGETPGVVESYLTASQGAEAPAARTYEEDPEKDVQIRSVRVANAQGEVAQALSCDEAVTLEVDYQVRRPVGGIFGCLQITNGDGVPVLLSYSYDHVPNPLDDGLPVGRHALRVTIPARSLAAGRYTVQLSFAQGRTHKRHVDDPGTVAAFTLDDFTTSKGNARIGYFSTILPWQVRVAAEPGLREPLRVRENP